jgi:hypothetical protein
MYEFLQIETISFELSYLFFASTSSSWVRLEPVSSERHSNRQVTRRLSSANIDSKWNLVSTSWIMKVKLETHELQDMIRGKVAFRRVHIYEFDNISFVGDSWMILKCRSSQRIGAIARDFANYTHTKNAQRRNNPIPSWECSWRDNHSRSLLALMTLLFSYLPLSGDLILHILFARYRTPSEPSCPEKLIWQEQINLSFQFPRWNYHLMRKYMRQPRLIKVEWINK